MWQHLLSFHCLFIAHIKHWTVVCDTPLNGMQPLVVLPRRVPLQQNIVNGIVSDDYMYGLTWFVRRSMQFIIPDILLFHIHVYEGDLYRFLHWKEWINKSGMHERYYTVWWTAIGA